MEILTNWVTLSILAAVTFGLGDFVVVLSESKNMDVLTLYITYCILIGILSFLYIAIFHKKSFSEIGDFGKTEWFIVLAFSSLYFFAYMTHFVALQKAPNPGYSNALIMFHVIILTSLSYLYLNKPLNWQTVLGIAITFLGSYLVINYSNV